LNIYAPAEPSLEKAAQHQTKQKNNLAKSHPALIIDKFAASMVDFLNEAS